MSSRPDRFPRLFSAWEACHLPPWWAPRRRSSFFLKDNSIPKDHPGLSRSIPFQSLCSCSGSLVLVPSDPDPDFPFSWLSLRFHVLPCNPTFTWMVSPPVTSSSLLPSSLSQCSHMQLISIPGAPSYALLIDEPLSASMSNSNHVKSSFEETTPISLDHRVAFIHSSSLIHDELPDHLMCCKC